MNAMAKIVEARAEVPLLDRVAFGATIVILVYSAVNFGQTFTAVAYMFMGAATYASGMCLVHSPRRTRWLALTSVVGFSLGLMFPG